MTVTACPSTESPRNSRRSLWAMPPCSYAYERWVSASWSSSGSTETCSCVARAERSGSCCSADTGAPPDLCWSFKPVLVRPDESDVGDLAALVLHVQRRASGVFDNLRAVREAVDDLAALDGLHQGGGGSLPLGAAHTGARTGHLALGNCHDYLFSLPVSPSGAVPVLSVGVLVASARPSSPASAAHQGSVGFSCSWPGLSRSRTPHSGHRPGQSS